MTMDEQPSAYFKIGLTMLREQGVWAVDHKVCTCGPTTGHTVRVIAMCESPEIAKMMAEAFSTVPA